jgi:hypothetical protein
MTQIQIKPIGNLRTNRFHQIAVKAQRTMFGVLDQGGTQTKIYLDGTIEYWANPPTMQKTTSIRGGEISSLVQPVGTGEQVAKWKILNRGGPRYAKMKRPPEFIRKTHPRTLRTNPGTMPSKAGVEYYTWPFPIADIEARGWTKLTMLLMRRWLRGKARKAIKDALK